MSIINTNREWGIKMNKQLKADFKNLVRDFKTVTINASDYGLEEFLGYLESLKKEVDFEVNIVRKIIKDGVR